MIVLPNCAVREGLQPKIQLAEDLWALTEWPLELDDHWKGWLGSLEVERLEDPSLILITKGPSKNPDVLNAESQEREALASYLREGLLLAGWFAEWDRDSLISGCNGKHGIRVQQYQRFERTQFVSAAPFHRIDEERILAASSLVPSMMETRERGRYIRMKAAWRAFDTAMAARYIEDRLHQFVRCVEGFIYPEAGRTRRQFKSRTELFVGTDRHDQMHELFEIRCAVEHLHPAHSAIERGSQREGALVVFERAVQAEAIARYCIRRFLESEVVRRQFVDDAAISRFWSVDDDERREIWGAPLDLNAEMTCFKPDRLDDWELGLA